MTIYSLINFLHVTSSIGIVVALSFENLMMVKMQRVANSDQFKAWKELHTLPLRLGGSSLVVSLITGIYLTVTMWPSTPWIWPSTVALVLFSVASFSLANASHRKFLVSDSIHEMRDAWQKLWLSLLVRNGLIAGILYLMVAKPSFEGSLAALAFWLVLFTLPIKIFKKRFETLSEPL